MKIRNALRARKQILGSQVVRRRGKTYVINKKNPRMKARQGWPTHGFRAALQRPRERGHRGIPGQGWQ